MKRFVRATARMLAHGIAQAVTAWLATQLLRYGLHALLMFLSHR